MQIALSAELAAFVDEQVRAGRFSSATEVVEAALARMKAEPHEPPDDPSEAETLAAIERAEAEFDRGEARPFDVVFDELRRKHFGR